MVNSIQFLRAIAALMVVYYHAAYMVSVRAGYGGLFSNAGAAGVDIFFVISGFVIFLVSNKSGIQPREFIAKRLIRVAPPYWFYTLITIAILLFIPGAYANLKFDLLSVITSFLFLLSDTGGGGIGTVLGVGWTLAYEMYFYMLFFVALLLASHAPFAVVTVVIVAGAALSLVIESAPPFTLVFLSTLPLEFLAGCVIAKLHLRSKHLHPAVSMLLIVIGLCSIYYSAIANLVSSQRDLWRVVYFGIPATLIVYGFVSIDAAKLVRFPRFALLLGSASYSIYLCHQFVLAATAKVWVVLNLKGALPSEVLLIIGIAASIFGGVISYWFFERPVTAWLNKEFEKKKRRISNPA